MASTGAALMLAVWLLSAADGTGTAYRLLGLGFVLLLGTSLAFAIASTIRRLHDLGKSGLFAWLLLIPTVNLVLVLLLCLLRGNDRANRYGGQP